METAPLLFLSMEVNTASYSSKSLNLVCARNKQYKMQSEQLERVEVGHGKHRHCTDKARFAFRHLTVASIWRMDLTRMKLKGAQEKAIAKPQACGVQ